MYVQANKTDEPLEYNKLVIKQMDRCNIALSQGARQFSLAIIAFRCMLAHKILRDKFYPQDMEKINNELEAKKGAIKNPKIRERHTDQLNFEASIAEYQALVRLCARQDLFPPRVGELTSDDDE